MHYGEDEPVKETRSIRRGRVEEMVIPTKPKYRRIHARVEQGCTGDGKYNTVGSLATCNTL